MIAKRIAQKLLKAQGGFGSPLPTPEEADDYMNHLPSVLYHATFSVHEKPILKNGLLLSSQAPLNLFNKNPDAPQDMNGVYLAADPQVALGFLDRAWENEDIPEGYFKKYSLFQVNVNDLDLTKLEPDPQYWDYELTYIYRGTIPASALTLVKE